MPEIYTVYGLIDPRDSSLFYVGVTKNPERRKREHFSPRYLGFPTFDRCSEIKRHGVLPRMATIWLCETKAEAFNVETFILAAIPNLVNRAKKSSIKVLAEF